MAEHKIAKTSDIEQGTGKKFTIEGQTIAVFNKGEEFFAIEDTCKHKGGSLGEGKLAGETPKPLNQLLVINLIYNLAKFCIKHVLCYR